MSLDGRLKLNYSKKTDYIVRASADMLGCSSYSKICLSIHNSMRSGFFFHYSFISLFHLVPAGGSSMGLFDGSSPEIAASWKPVQQHSDTCYCTRRCQKFSEGVYLLTF